MTRSAFSVLRTATNVMTQNAARDTQDENGMFAEVVFNLPLEKAFHYAIPGAWANAIRPGMRVLAPFGRRQLIGTVTALPASTPIAQPKELLRVIDAEPALTPETLKLAQWMADYYGCSLGQACASVVPSALRLRPVETAASIPPTHPDGPAFTDQQRAAFAPLEEAVRAERFASFLIHGVTGSGKTELYLRTIALSLAQGRGAIVLVPEIALTPQTIDRFRERFGSEVVLWHSRLTMRQRAVAWQQLAQGRSRVIVGTRSAVFAPLARVGVIVLDEEHDPSYKQDQTPRYHARDVALARARLSSAVVMLGSATPSIESSYDAQEGRYALLELTQRVRGRPLPTVEIVDMRQQVGGRQKPGAVSDRLLIALKRVVEQQEQAILLLNRRGFARVALCQTCGVVMRCPSCTVPMIYHASSQTLLCHYCGAQQPIPEICPSCQKGYLRLRGAGTERIESELHRLFPASGIGRMDTDTTKGRESHRKFYESIKARQINLLVGTQMVAKGLDLPQVTLVGVVSADTALNLPDFRAGERTFDLLTQVAGRAGRGDRPGQVLIQTYCPTHYAIQAASRHDYQAFYRAEIQMRRRLKLPPFVHFVELTVQGSRRERVRDAAQRLKDVLAAHVGSASIKLLGPAPHRIERLRKTFRWRVVLKARTVAPMLKLVRQALPDGHRLQGLPVLIDVDPL